MLNPPRPRPRRGFTIVEMLVVIGIIAVLASITLVVLSKARRSADRSRLAFQLQSISVALEAYQTDFLSFPITTPTTATATTDPEYYINASGLRGARTLCKALMGPCVGSKSTDKNVFTLQKSSQDGKDGLGFAFPGRSGVLATDPNTGELIGKTYGPYLAPDKFRLAKSDPAGVVDLAAKDYDDTTVLLDGNDNPVLYYPALNPQAPIQLQYAYVSRGYTRLPTPVQEAANADGYNGTPMYNSTDNDFWLSAPALRKILGDVRGATGTGGPDGRISPAVAAVPAEAPAIRGKYILWTAGPDGFFGPNPATSGKDAGKVDDVNSFQGD